MSSLEQRYYDCVRKQFYIYDEARQQWKGERVTFDKGDGRHFYFDTKRGQWVPTEFLMMYYRERGRLPVSSPFPAEKKELEEDDNKRHPAANGDAPYPSPSTNMQAEIDAQLAITLHEAA